MTTPSYPFGYKYSKTGECAIEASKAGIVRWIFEAFISGKNRYEIQSELNRRGIKRPSGKGGQWHYSMISRILKDDRYTGTPRYPALLDETTFAKATARFSDDRSKAIAVRTPGCTDFRKYPLSGFLQCGTCGAVVRRVTLRSANGNRKCAWRCCKSVAHGNEKCPNYFNVYEEMLEIACREAFNRLLADPQQVCVERKRATGANCKSDEMRLARAIRMYKMAVGDLASPDVIAEFEAEVNRLLAEQTAQIWQNTTPELTAYQTEEIIAFLKRQEPMDLFDEAKLKAVFEKIIFLEPGKLGFVLKNGKQIEQTYTPMKGQVQKWQRR